MAKVIEMEPEHPEDTQARIEGEKYGMDRAPEFYGEFAEEMTDLIGLYPDSEAHALLDELREKFWTRDWKPKG